MRHRRRPTWAAILLLGAAGAARGAVAAGPATPDAAGDPRIARWLADLAAADPDQRARAARELVSAGRAAEPPLRRAVNDPATPPAVRAAVRYALRRIALRFHPHKGITDLGHRAADLYLNDPSATGRALRLEVGTTDGPPLLTPAALVRLFLLEPDASLRRKLWEAIPNYRPLVPSLVADDDEDGVAAVVAAAVAYHTGGSAAGADYAAWAAYAGQGEAIRRQLRATMANDPAAAPQAAGVLCAMDRLAGRSDDAMAMAERSGDPAWATLVRQDRGDWAALADSGDSRWAEFRGAPEAFRAAYLRLAGRRAAADAAADELVRVVGPPPAPPGSTEDPPDLFPKPLALAVDNDPSPFMPAKLLLINDRPERGIEVLAPTHPAAAFEMLQARGQYAEALALADRLALHPTERKQLAAAKTDLRRLLGELPPLPVPHPATAPGAGDGPPDVPVEPPASPDGAGRPSVEAAFTQAYAAAVAELRAGAFDAAAGDFARAYAADGERVDCLYLQGTATAAGGDGVGGRALQARATLALLGDPNRWDELAGRVAAAGRSADADRLRAAALRTGSDAGEFGFVQVYSAQLNDLTGRKQWAAAAAVADRLCLGHLPPNIWWTDPVDFLAMPARAHLLHGQALREAGDVAGSERELAAANRYLPDAAQTALRWVPWLDGRGEHAAADATFDRTYAVLGRQAAAYPRSAFLQNQLAWLAACCCRRLDEAVAHAEAAVKLEPENWELADTLAEARFRRGDRAGAVEAERRAAALAGAAVSDRYRAYLDRQAKRFAAADVPSTTRPVEEPTTAD